MLTIRLHLVLVLRMSAALDTRNTALLPVTCFLHVHTGAHCVLFW
jgi:hypothetical protein